jgi:hypothetical protein
MAKKFGEIEDSGERRGFDTGAKRDVDDDKPRYDLIPITVLHRLIDIYVCEELEDGVNNYNNPLPMSDDIKAEMLDTVFMWGEHGQDSNELLEYLMWMCIRLIQHEEGDQCLKVNRSRHSGFHFISPKTYTRLANHYGGGAKKYDSWNWSKGMPLSVFHASLMRHVFKIVSNETNEDHLSAIFFNAAAIIHFSIVKRKDVDDISDRLEEWGINKVQVPHESCPV